MRTLSKKIINNLLLNKNTANIGFKKNNKWNWITNKQLINSVVNCRNILQEHKIDSEDRIAYKGSNSINWISWNLATNSLGATWVPMYADQSISYSNFIIKDCNPRLLIQDENLEKNSNVQILSNDINYCENLDNNFNFIKPCNDLATLIYTSGTTGDPKGVMHKFRNFGFSATNAINTLDLDQETFFSYLPLSHIAERLLVEMGSLYTGGKVSFAESLDTFSSDLSKASPTIFLGVPRIWTKFQQGVLKKMPQKKLDFLLSIPIISNLIKNKIKKGLGLKNASNIFTGAAPTPISIIEWFKKLDIKIQEAYAMTENTCYSHVSFKSNIKIGSVGQPLPFCDVKLGENNEILIKHEALMDGYYKNKLETEKTISNGWLHTGDEGLIDSDNFLRITGRVKDIFKTSKGKYVAPSPIEMILSSNNNIEQVCVVGSGLPQPMALIVLSEEGEKKHLDILIKELKKTLNITNASLNKHEQLSNIVVLFDEWTVENKLLTPTMKIKRNELEKIYQKKYSNWCGSDQIVIT